VAIFAWVALGDPGKLPSRAKGHSGVEEIMNALDKDVPDDKFKDGYELTCLMGEKAIEMLDAVKASA